MAGFCCEEGESRTVPMLPLERSIFPTSKVTCKFIGGCKSCEGAKRMETTFEVGLSCNPLVLKAGVSRIEAISSEKVTCTVVCIPLAGSWTDMVGGAEGRYPEVPAGVIVLSGVIIGVIVGCSGVGCVEIILSKTLSNEGWAGE